MDDRTRAREWLDAPKRWLSWATLGNVSHAWERFPINAMGMQPESRATICGVESPTPAAWISGPGMTRCPECARIEAEPLTALLDSVRREALEEAERACESAHGGHRKVCADRVRALAPFPPPDDETKEDGRA